MTFVPTISPDSALQPDYAGSRKIERWTATAAAADIGPATVTARHLLQITDFDVESFGGTPPLSCAIRGNQLLIYLPGTASALTYRIRLESRY